MIERLCESCSKPVSGKLYKNLCRGCYDAKRKISSVAVPKKLQPLFDDYMGERDDVARGIIELMELGLKVWKTGRQVTIIPHIIVTSPTDLSHYEEKSKRDFWDSYIE